jgi:hypothetical protein
MSGLLGRFETAARNLIAIAALCLLPASLQAVWFGLRNDLGVPVLVYAASDPRKAPKSTVLNPGEVSMDCLVQPGDRFITIADRRNPKRIYFQARLPVTRDICYSLRPDGAGRIKLVVIKLPARPH